MALSPQQQQMYNQLVSAGASAQSALFAVQQIPSSAVSSPAPAIPTSAPAMPTAAPQTTPAAPTATPSAAPSTTPSVTPTPQANTAQQTTSANPAQQTTAATNPAAATGPSGTSGPQAPTIPANGSIVDLLNSQGQNSSYAARAQMAQQFGIQGYTGSAAQNQQLAQKYTDYFNSVKKTDAPNTNPRADITAGTSTQPTTDPVMSSLVNMYAPILASISQVMSDINNPAITNTNLQNEYNQLAQQNKLPEMNTELMNMQNVMNGTEQDIRDEVTKSGGFISESQIAALTASRNNVIVKQYNALATQYQAATTNIQNQMQFAEADRSSALQKQQLSASVAEGLASIEATMMNTGITMQQNAKQAVQYNVTQTGYSGLAASAKGNPQVLGYYEQMLNLAPGTLSDPTSLSSLDTYKQQQLAISEQNAQNAGTRTYIYGASQGIPLPGQGGTGGTTFGTGQTAAFTIPPNSLTRPTWLNANVPLSMSSSDMSQYLQSQKGAVIGGTAGTSQYGNNITIPNVGNYVVQPDGSYIIGSALPQELSTPEGVGGLLTSLSQPNPPTLNYSDIAAIMQNAPGSKYPPASTAFYREQRSARQLLGNFTGSPVYATVAQAPLPFARIQAARNGDNSVSDVELLDSYITLAKGQGQITEAQISAITSASSMSDKLNIIKQRVSGAGALISADQRKSLLSLSGSVFDQYSSQYKNLYTQAINVLAKNHMEPAVWGVIPDFTTMITTGDTFGNAEPQ